MDERDVDQNQFGKPVQSREYDLDTKKHRQLLIGDSIRLTVLQMRDGRVRVRVDQFVPEIVKNFELDTPHEQGHSQDTTT